MAIIKINHKKIRNFSPNANNPVKVTSNKAKSSTDRKSKWKKANLAV